ncbi:MAG TPA: O-antigen ligase family protein [Terriglobales bacterium]|nr:O-antigen ligase family protein [Terriglobales bacterium]
MVSPARRLAPARPAPPPRPRAEWGRRALLAAPLLAIGFAIAAFGGVYAWAYGLAYALVFLTLAAAAVQAARGRLRLRWRSPYLPLLLFGALLLLQLQLPLSVDPAATLTALLHLGAAAAVFILVSQAYRPRDAGWITLSFSLFTAALALLAILQILTASHGIYWRFTYAYASPAGSFVNRNHFAGCMEMLLPLACVAAYRRRERPWQDFLPWAAPPALGVAAMVLAASRGGLAALALQALAALLLGLYLRRRQIAGARLAAASAWLPLPARLAAPPRRPRPALPRRRLPGRLASLLIVVALTVGMVELVGTARLQARLGTANLQSPDFAQRLLLDQSTLAMFRERPLFGWGLGTWADVYPLFARFNSTAVYAFAHNDYLQLLAETGLAGAACVLLFWTLWGGEWARALRRWPPPAADPAAAALPLAAALGCLGLLVHSLVDFNLHIPANLLLFFVLAALALPSRPGGEGSIPLS